MRIGVVCEGPTDFHAIVSFFGHSLQSDGIAADFIPLQPKLDNTSAEGGWGNVLLWLINNPPASRVQQYFGGGLFEGGLGFDPLSCLLIHLDSDILSDGPFCEFVQTKFQKDVANPVAAGQRANEITSIICKAARLAEMSNADKERHVLAPAVESTEAWCVAAFTMPPDDFESLASQQLTDAFMCALERSEGNEASPPYAKINKSTKRRKRFCERHAASSDRVLRSCAQFRSTYETLTALFRAV